MAQPRIETKMAEELEKPAEVTPQPERNPLFKWYILHAYSGFERKVRESIASRVEAFGLKDKVGRVMIPTEPVTQYAPPFSAIVANDVAIESPA